MTTQDPRWIGSIVAILSILLASSCTFEDADQATRRSIEQGTITQKPSADQHVPSPDLTPEEIVRIQVEALRNNDDTGIATAYRFATARNKETTGPLERFTSMVKGPEYSSMLEYTEIEYLPVSFYGDIAQQLVVIEVGHQVPECFLFILSKQDQGTYRGCWMTEAVLRGRLEEPAPRERITAPRS